MPVEWWGWCASIVAPPRGERGLKLLAVVTVAVHMRRSPSWGAWIEIREPATITMRYSVAPPRGERGLKWA